MATLYATAPETAAESIARTLIEERLAACVNRVDCASTYRWEGEIHEDDEEILLVKTTDGRAAKAADRIETLHPYEVPCIERFDEDDVLPAFAEWRAESVAD
jgi:periplasmic divalent cation tolerance protein